MHIVTIIGWSLVIMISMLHNISKNVSSKKPYKIRRTSKKSYNKKMLNILENVFYIYIYFIHYIF